MKVYSRSKLSQSRTMMGSVVVMLGISAFSHRWQHIEIDVLAEKAKILLKSLFMAVQIQPLPSLTLRCVQSLGSKTQQPLEEPWREYQHDVECSNQVDAAVLLAPP